MIPNIADDRRRTGRINAIARAIRVHLTILIVLENHVSEASASWTAAKRRRSCRRGYRVITADGSYTGISSGRSIGHGFRRRFWCVPATMGRMMIGMMMMVMAQLCRRSHLMVLIEMCIRIRRMNAWIVNVHQRVDGEIVLIGSQMIERIRACIQQWIRCKMIFWYEVRRQIESGLFFEVMLGIQHGVRHQFDRFDVHQFLFERQGAFHCLFFLTQSVLLLETTATPQVRSVVEHAVRIWVQCPVTALARLFIITRHFHKALVQTEIVTNGILPALLVVAIIRELFHNVLIDSIKRHLFVGWLLYGHRDQSNVRVWRFDDLLVLVRSEAIGSAWIRISWILVVGIMRWRSHCRSPSRVAALRIRVMPRERILIGKYCMHFHRFFLYCPNFSQNLKLEFSGSTSLETIDLSLVHANSVHYAKQTHCIFCFIKNSMLFCFYSKFHILWYTTPMFCVCA